MQSEVGLPVNPGFRPLAPVHRSGRPETVLAGNSNSGQKRSLKSSPPKVLSKPENRVLNVSETTVTSDNVLETNFDEQDYENFR